MVANLGLIVFTYKRVHKEQMALKRKSVEIMFEWTPMKYARMVGVCFIAGILAGSLGIAGGLLMGPILLVIGLDPRISTATSNFMGTFTAFSTSFQ
mmetsp:Transcript_36703/g.79935  ORF Transcript_36703/g.79935 Transcript_36703/m.79935 type:complete len:96 (+) Transcript_36703:886-1173(+)